MADYPIVLYPKPIAGFLKAVESRTRQTPPPPTKPQEISKTKVDVQLKTKGRNVTIQPTLVLIACYLLIPTCLLIFDRLPNWALLIIISSSFWTLIYEWRQQKDKIASSLSEARSIKGIPAKDCDKIHEKSAESQKKHLYTVELYRKKLKTQLTTSAMAPQGYSDAPQGAAEEQFKSYLETYFPRRIHQGLKFHIPNAQHSYSADFTYADNEFGLWIDIEIDEPYYYKNGSPTHACDDDKDKIRNLFFLKGNWVIIRFAEEQVVRQPNECCKAIAEVVVKIAGETKLLEKFKTLRDLRAVHHWTTEEAKRMARAKFRDKY